MGRSRSSDSDIETPLTSPAPYIDENWIAHPSDSPVVRMESLPKVAQWQSTFAAQQRRRQATPLHPIEPYNDAPSPVMSDWSDESNDTVMYGEAYPQQGVYSLDPPYCEDKYASICEFE